MRRSSKDHQVVAILRNYLGLQDPIKIEDRVPWHHQGYLQLLLKSYNLQGMSLQLVCVPRGNKCCSTNQPPIARYNKVVGIQTNNKYKAVALQPIIEASNHPLVGRYQLRSSQKSFLLRDTQ